MQRPVIIKIDDLLNILKTYLGEDDLPKTAKPLDFLINPRQRNMLALRVTDDRWDGEQGTQLVDVQMKRYFGVGNARN